MALAGFFMSIVNAPMHALITLRMPRELRTQGLAAIGVFQSIGAPIGLVLAGWALAQFDTRSVLMFVLAVQTLGVGTFVVTAPRRALDASGCAVRRGGIGFRP